MPCTVTLVISFFGKIFFGFFADFYPYFFRFQQKIELVNFYLCNGNKRFQVKRIEFYHRTQTVHEFRREKGFECLVRFHGSVFVESHNIGFFCPYVGSHDKNNILEIAHYAVIVRQLGTVHYLKENIHDVRMRLFYFIKQQYSMRMFLDHFCQ